MVRLWNTDPDLANKKNFSQSRSFPRSSVADSDDFKTDPDHAFHFDTDLDPDFQFDTDPDPIV